MDVDLTDEHLYARRKEASDALKLFTAWMDGWGALEKGSLNFDCDNRCTAARYFLRNLAHIRSADVDDLPVLTIHQLLEPDSRQDREALLRCSGATRATWPSGRATGTS
eukprot:15433302-Alexandrium_andersonii.AAC.1